MLRYNINVRGDLYIMRVMGLLAIRFGWGDEVLNLNDDKSKIIDGERGK